MRKRLLAALAAGLLATGSAQAMIETNELPYPKELQITVESRAVEREGWKDAERDVPVTCDESVNALLEESSQRLYDEMLAIAKPEERVDMLSAYRVSGTSWAGFLLTGRVVSLADSKHKTYLLENTEALSYEAYSFDMKTGRALTLADVFAPSSPAWDEVCRVARERLTSYYASEARDQEALDRLCSKEELAKRPFLPGAGQLSVPFALWEILPARRQIVYVLLPYPDFREQMTEAAFAQTDNSARPMIALTMDDGPNRLNTQSMLRSLGQYGAVGTFFAEGKYITRWPDLLRRESDMGNSLASHSMEHRSPGREGEARLKADREAVLAQHAEVAGISPRVFRAPGGAYPHYIKHSVGWPLIQWTESVRDTGNYSPKRIATHVNYAVRDGDIILMHDSIKESAQAMPLYLEKLRERGFMFATVEELLYLHGVTPEGDQVYWDGFGSNTRPAHRK